MDFLELARTRYAVRSYLPRAVEQDKLDRVLEAVRLAPSGSNRQPWKFIVVRDPELRRLLVEACAQQRFIAEAPVVVAGIGLMPERIMSCEIPGDSVDVSIALTHLALAAAAEGLGTCWIGAFHQDSVRQVLGVPPRHGDRPDDAGLRRRQTPPQNRKPLREIILWEKWQ